MWASVMEDDRNGKRGKRIHFTHMHLNMLDPPWEEIVLGQTRKNILKLTDKCIYMTNTNKRQGAAHASTAESQEWV
jgi:hypothetical protein